MTLSTRIEVFYGFYICSQWAFIHALLSRVPFALAGLSCFLAGANHVDQLTRFWSFHLFGWKRSGPGHKLRPFLTDLPSKWSSSIPQEPCLTGTSLT